MSTDIAKKLGLGLAVGVLGAVLAILPPVSNLEEQVGLKSLFLLRGARPPPAEVAVIAVDDESSAQLGVPEGSENWPRRLHARLVRALHRAGARAVAFDIFFDPTRLSHDDPELVAAIGAAGNVVLVELLRRGSEGAASVESIAQPAGVEAARAVAPFVLPVPGRVDYYWAFRDSAGGVPTLPAAALQVFGLDAARELLRRVRLGPPDGQSELLSRLDDALVRGDIVPVLALFRQLFQENPSLAQRLRRELAPTGGGQPGDRVIRALIGLYARSEPRYLNFYGEPLAIRTYSYREALELAEGDRAVEHFAGRAVFVGLSESRQVEQRDSYETPFSSRESGLRHNGVEIAATAFANLLDDFPVEPLSRIGAAALLLAWGLVVGLACGWLAPGFALAVAAGLAAAYGAVVLNLFASHGVWLPLVVPLAVQAPVAFGGAIAGRYWAANREREHIRRAFSRYLPPTVVEELVRTLGDGVAHSRLVYGTCVATDAERYTAIAEGMDPVALARLMNDYYAAIFRPIEQFGGFVSDVVGDAALALWAARTPDSALRENACRAALAIAGAVREFNRTSGRPPLYTRIGLDFGAMSLGSVGAGGHYEYRAVGDIVNTANRLQNLNKELGTCTLVSEAVLEGTEGFRTRFLGRFSLPGKAHAVPVHELRGRRDEDEGRETRLCQAFADALAAFEAGDRECARARFRAILEEFPEDGPSRYYLNAVFFADAKPTSTAVRDGAGREILLSRKYGD